MNIQLIMATVFGLLALIYLLTDKDGENIKWMNFQIFLSLFNLIGSQH